MSIHAIMLRSLVCVASVLAACGPYGEAPRLAPIDDQVVAVGTELVVLFRGTDSDGDQLSYSFAAPGLRMDGRAQLTRRPDGTAEFHWVPAAADVGTWYVDFRASDGHFETTITAKIVVLPATDRTTIPSFVRPLGTGTTLDLENATCVELSTLVDDSDTATVDIAQEPPLIEGATLVQTGEKTASWKWCPSADQIDGAMLYSLNLSADDHDHPKTMKNYLVVLRRPESNCPGDGPIITHTPSDETTSSVITITAEVEDDSGLSSAPLLYYSMEPPANPVNIAAMIQLSMNLVDGDLQRGTWTVDVPNPASGLAAGSQASLYYVIAATDDDVDCSHLTEAPEVGAHKLTVTSPGEVCVDDASEDDDDDTLARTTDIFPNPFVSSDNAICSNDDDWYLVELYTGETVEIDLTFTQTNPDGDLDLHIYNASLTDLTPCSESDPSTCSTDQGQSVTSNEHFEGYVDTSGCFPCTYYVVVHGWDGAENDYDITIGLK